MQSVKLWYKTPSCDCGQEGDYNSPIDEEKLEEDESLQPICQDESTNEPEGITQES